MSAILIVEMEAVAGDKDTDCEHVRMGNWSTMTSARMFHSRDKSLVDILAA